MDTGLSGKVVLITGASGGIGSGIARQFAAESAKLVLHYRNGIGRAKLLQRELRGTETLLVQADLQEEKEVCRLFAKAVRKFGRIDTLVANAGEWETRDIQLKDMSYSQWRATFSSVLDTVFLSAREFLRQVAVQERGNAILIGSTAAVFGEAGHADYAAAKSAIAYGLTRSMKNELARIAPHTADYCGGRVNCICPGWTIVPRLAHKLRDADTIRKVTATMAIPQLGRPEDIGNAALFLASDTLARHITGQTIVIAGGMEGRWLWQPEEVNTGIV